MEFFEQTAEQFIQAMIVYNKDTGDTFKDNQIIDIVNKLNTHDKASTMIIPFIAALKAGANEQVTRSLDAIKEKWEKEYLNTLIRGTSQ